MVIAFLMWRFSLAYEEAHEKVRKVRPICNPNAGFTFQLLVHAKKLGLSGCHSAPSETPALFRVAPYHPKEPFLLLFPVEWTPGAPPAFDPRFGWVAQRGVQLVVWIGSQVHDGDAVKASVELHAQRLETFEKCQCVITVMREGEEKELLWQLLDLPNAPEDKDSLVVVKPCFDADFEVLQSVVAGPGPADGLRTDPTPPMPQSVNSSGHGA
jgi:hypothetical protein